MILDYKQIQFKNKKIFEKVKGQPPIQDTALMPDEACFYFISMGKGGVYSNQGKTTIEEKEGLVLQCGNYIYEFLASDDYDECEVVAIHLYPEILKDIYEKEIPTILKDIDKTQPVNLKLIKGSSPMRNYIDSLDFYFENATLVSDELIKLKLKELIILLAKTDNKDAIKMLIGGVFNKKTISFQETIEANIFSNLNLEQLAALTNLSLSSFKREFQKQYKTTPAKYIKKRKLEKAANLLVGTDLRITTITFDCGFNDLAHFSKSFQKEYGVSPSDYRLNVLNKSLN